MRILALTLMALLGLTQLTYSPDSNAAGRTREEEIAKNIAQYNRNNQKIQLNTKKINHLNSSINSLNLKGYRLSYKYGQTFGTFEAFGVANDIKVNKNSIKEKNLEITEILEENKFLAEENKMLLEANKNL